MQRPSFLYTIAQCRAIEQHAISQLACSQTLMHRAGQAALDFILSYWAIPEHLHILCGTGNNGGDGLTLATLAKKKGLNVSVYLLGEPAKMQGEAKVALQEALAANITPITFDASLPLTEGIIIDALFGIGLSLNIRDSAKQAIAWVNQANLPVLSLDVPSGLCADTGNIFGSAIKADKTLTFVVAKRGLYTHHGSAVCGDILLNSLGLFPPTLDAIEHFDLPQLMATLPARPRDAHKGLFGHVLVIGGDYGMAGAAILAAKACARAGAGLVSVASRKQHINAILSHCPEVMAHGVASGQELEPLLEKPNVIVLGPGLGQSPWSEQLLQRALACNTPLVIDADALNLLSQERFASLAMHNNWVLTPHPGEAARLLKCTSADVNQNRFSAASTLQERFSGTILLKGAGTIIQSDSRTALCSYGNPGMASGGMGDLLSGLIAGLMAQGLNGFEAASLAATLHAKAADTVAKQYGERGLLASDLFPSLRYLINGKY